MKFFQQKIKFIPGFPDARKNSRIPGKFPGSRKNSRKKNSRNNSRKKFPDKFPDEAIYIIKHCKIYKKIFHQKLDNIIYKKNLQNYKKNFNIIYITLFLL